MSNQVGLEDLQVVGEVILTNSVKRGRQVATVIVEKVDRQLSVQLFLRSIDQTSGIVIRRQWIKLNLTEVLLVSANLLLLVRDGVEFKINGLEGKRAKRYRGGRRNPKWRFKCELRTFKFAIFRIELQDILMLARLLHQAYNVATKCSSVYG